MINQTTTLITTAHTAANLTGTMVSQYADIPMSRINRDDWFALPNKAQTGDRALQYFFVRHLYFRPQGSKVATEVCDRCHMKMYLDDMVEDGNSPGLRIHRHCSDNFDPWRLPPPALDRIALPFARHDTDIAVTDE